ncbi:hypothetical protein ACFV6B_26770 [Streptomyces microflavus]|uniref:hypothetical protein n=1 Tax=Streptomyces microflavus TaxID=1919 RepID=UPI00365D0C01
MRFRRRAHLAWAVAAAAAAALLVPQPSFAEAEPAAQTAATSIVYDPGPRLRCYSVAVEDLKSSYGNDSSDCAAIDNPNRWNQAPPSEGGCQWFGYTSKYGTECPAWRFVTHGWDPSELRTYPGYDHQILGQSGSPLKLTLQNNSRHSQDGCRLKESTFSYEYTGSSLKRNSAGGVYNFGDGRLKASYDALVDQSGDFRCDEKRAILTTDLMWHHEGRIFLISAVHFDPGKFDPPNADGVLWDNGCKDNPDQPQGCRVTVYGERINENKTTRINVDFTALAQQYQEYLGGEPIGAASQIESVQVVNSTKGADLKAEVSNVDVTIG